MKNAGSVLLSSNKPAAVVVPESRRGCDENAMFEESGFLALAGFVTQNQRSQERNMSESLAEQWCFAAV